MKIEIPNICVEEVKYTFKILFEEFLGVEYSIEVNDELKDFLIYLPEGTILIKNKFFTTDDIKVLYRINKIPENVKRDAIEINGEEFNLSCIYGNLNIVKNSENIQLDLDIIGSSYFMLSRWEEYANKERDKLGRFIGANALSVKFDFYDKCVVNEYVNFLWALMLDKGLHSTRKQRKFNAVITHDIDSLKLWKTSRNFLGSLKNLIREGEISQFFNYIRNYLFGKNDPYNNLNYLSDSTHKLGLKTIFYFKTFITNKSYDHNDYQIESLGSTFEKLKSRNQIIGIHPSFNTSTELIMLRSEIEKLEKASSEKVEYSRQHYLKFDVPITWRYLDQLGVVNDSSMMYSDHFGFRNGTCYSFSTFDILDRKSLDLKEQPLNFMETTALFSLKMNTNDILNKIEHLILEIKQYQGTFTILWHNSNLILKSHRLTYSLVLQKIRNHYN